MNELIYHTITPAAQEVGGDYMLILTADSTIDEIVQYILSSKVIWFYDGALYHPSNAAPAASVAVKVTLSPSHGSASDTVADVTPLPAVIAAQT